MKNYYSVGYWLSLGLLCLSQACKPYDPPGCQLGNLTQVRYATIQTTSYLDDDGCLVPNTSTSRRYNPADAALASVVYSKFYLPFNNALIINEDGADTAYVFLRNVAEPQVIEIPSSIRQMNACELRQMLRTAVWQPVGAYVRPHDERVSRQGNTEVLWEKGTYPILESTQGTYKVRKFSITTVTERYNGGYSYNGLPDYVYPASAQTINPVFIGNGASPPTTRRFWTTSPTLRLNNQGRINVNRNSPNRSEPTPAGRTDNIYYQLANDPVIYRIRFIYYRQARLSTLNVNQLLNLSVVIYNEHISRCDKDPCRVCRPGQPPIGGMDE